MNKAAQELGRLGGKKKLLNGGREAFVAMAKKSWEKRNEINPKTGQRSRKKLSTDALDKS